MKSKYFVINGYRPQSDFHINEDDFRMLHNLLYEAFDQDLMKADLLHMDIINFIKEICIQVQENKYDHYKNSNIESQIDGTS